MSIYGEITGVITPNILFLQNNDYIILTLYMVNWGKRRSADWPKACCKRHLNPGSYTPEATFQHYIMNNTIDQV